MSEPSEHLRSVPGPATAPEAGDRSAPLPGITTLPDDAVSLDHATARRELLELSIAAAGIGTFDWDLVDGTLTWDDRLIELFGYDKDTFDRSIEGFNARLHPDDLPRVGQDLRAAVESCGEFASEYRVVLPGGHQRWIGARGRTLCDESGTAVRMLGAAWDITAHREGEARLRGVLESMATAFFSLDASWRFTYVNAEAERVLGRSAEELVGGLLWELFPAAVGSEFERHYRRAMATGETVTFEAYYPPPLDAWYEVRAWRSPDGLAVYFLDVTTRRLVEQESERATRRARLLGRITEELVGTLDQDEAATRLARLVVPTLADWCVVTLVEDDARAGARRGLRNAGAWHSDPRLQPATEAYARSRLQALADDGIVVRAMETGLPQLLPTGATAAIQGMLDPGPVHDLLGLLAPESAVVLPLTGRNGTVGLLSLCNGADRGPFTPDDMVTAGHVAGRAGLVLDNARLYRQQLELAEGLQRALLTEPPEPDHTQVVVRYTPAAEAAQVGGDWYDAFLQPSGSTVLVIGDVVGHDVQAAAAMGQVRTVVRTTAVVTEAGPAEILRRVDSALETLQMGTTATAVVARLEQAPEERAQGVTRLRWSNAGHPPPMVVDADGTVRTLSGPSPNLLLGVIATSSRSEAEVRVERGATVLLYTDGLVERRDQSLQVGLSKLEETLEELGPLDLPLDDLVDELLLRMLPPEPADDVAIVAVRLHPQDRPRPAEAGPQRVPPTVPVEPVEHAGG